MLQERRGEENLISPSVYRMPGPELAHSPRGVVG